MWVKGRARRALDYLVGYGLSPVLWRKLPGCRSAGRVQSVALRLICEREAGIEAFVPRQYWTVEAEAEAGDGGSFGATLVRLDGTDVGESGLASERSAREAAGRIREARFRAVAVERDTLQRPPNPPFATATPQLAAFRRLPIFRNDFGDRFGGQDASVVLKLVVGEIILSEQVEMPP